MRGKIVLAVVLCLVAAAALGIGAAPALAASGCTCHTAVPPTGGAPAAHAPLVVGVDCTGCHKGMTVPHSGPITSPNSWVGGKSIDAGYRLFGEIYDNPMIGVHVPHPGVTVYLQKRALGATAFTDVGQVTTTVRGLFGFTVTSPVRYTFYRAVAQGWIGPTWTSLPSLDNLPPKPKLTLRLSGLTAGAVNLGGSITAKVKASPAEMAGETVKFRVQERVGVRWVTRLTVKRTLSATATSSWTYTTRERGAFHVRASNVRSANFATWGSGWHKYFVK